MKPLQSSPSLTSHHPKVSLHGRHRTAPSWVDESGRVLHHHRLDALKSEGLLINRLSHSIVALWRHKYKVQYFKNRVLESIHDYHKPRSRARMQPPYNHVFGFLCHVAKKISTLVIIML